MHIMNAEKLPGRLEPTLQIWDMLSKALNPKTLTLNPTREARPLGLLIRQDLGSTGRSTEDMAVGSSNSNNTHGNDHSSGNSNRNSITNGYYSDRMEVFRGSVDTSSWMHL